MTARQVSILEMYQGKSGAVSELLSDMREMNRRLEELIRDPLEVIAASWAGPPWDESADVYGYSHDGREATDLTGES